MTTSGWFGEVPEGWQAAPLFGIATERKIPNKGLRETNLLSLSYGRIVRKDIETNEGLLPASFETYQIVKPDDIVLRMTDLQNDQRSLRSALVGETGIITSAYLALALRNVDSRFMAYQFRAIDLMKVFYSMGGGLRQSIGFGDLKRLPVLTPPLEEQRAIADYLDRETAQIDAFIAKNEELITLLNERRLVEISRAISGDWPEVQLRALSTVPIQNGVDAIGDPANPQEWPRYVRTTDIESLSSLDPEKRVTIAPDVAAASPLVKDDILLTRAGATIGKSYLHSSGEVASYAGYLVRVRPDRRRVLPWYLAYWTQSQEYLDQIRSGAVISTIENFSASKYRALRVQLPTIDVQAEIVDRIRRSSADAHRAMAMATAAIELARERRAALISSAVTGKIEVGVST